MVAEPAPSDRRLPDGPPRQGWRIAGVRMDSSTFMENSQLLHAGGPAPRISVRGDEKPPADGCRRGLSDGPANLSGFVRTVRIDEWAQAPRALRRRRP